MPDGAPETVSLDSITNTPVKPPAGASKPLPADVDPFTGKRDERLDQHLGRVGLFIGGGPEKSGNIAYIVILVSLLLLIVGTGASAWSASEKLAAVFDRIVTGSFSLITGALGYLFGKSGSKD